MQFSQPIHTKGTKAKVPQLIRLLEQGDIPPRYLQPPELTHTRFKPLRCFIARVGPCYRFQPSVDVRLLFVERFGSVSGGFDMVFGGFGGIREDFLGFC